MDSNVPHERKLHKDRPDLIGEYRYGDSGQIVLFIVFLIVWVGDSFVLHYTDFPAGHIPLIIRLPIGVLVLAAAAYFAGAGHKRLFSEARESPGIMSDGVFGRTRHPLYLGSVLFYLGLVFITVSIGSLALWIIILAFYHFIARYEEKLLQDSFGEDYLDYMAAVPMWFPRFR